MTSDDFEPLTRGGRKYRITDPYNRVGAVLVQGVWEVVNWKPDGRSFSGPMRLEEGYDLIPTTA